MTLTNDFQGDQRKRITDSYETFLHSLALLRGDRLSPDQASRIVGEAVAGASPDELRSPVPAASAIGRLQQLLVQAVEAGRPHNIHSAEAARLAQLGAHGTAGLLGHKGYADLQQARREAARDARDGRDGGERGGGRSGDRYGELPAAGDRVSSAVTSAYVQQYAGTGLGRGTVQTFAEIGLQRGVYDAYRKEGFSREDIGDAAKTTKTLGWKNDRQAFDDVQRSTRPERAAIVEIHGEKDEEKQKVLIERKRRDLHIDDKPQAAQDRWNRNIDRVQHHHHDVDQRHGVGASAKQADGLLSTGRTQDHGRPASAKVRVAKLEVSEAKSEKASAKAMDDGFGTVSTPTKVAEAKPASSGPKVG